MGKTAEIAKRPTSITVICVLWFIGSFLTVPKILLLINMVNEPDLYPQPVGTWVLLFVVFMFFCGLACMAGLWVMKKWAAYTLTGLFALGQIILLVNRVWDVKTLILAVVVFFALKNVSKMT